MYYNQEAQNCRIDGLWEHGGIDHWANEKYYARYHRMADQQPARENSLHVGITDRRLDTCQHIP
jgi:hypothetical protein